MRAISLNPGWRVVVGAGVSVGFGAAVFLSVAFPLIAAAIAKAQGWSQTDVAKGASAILLMQAVGYPVAGFLIDRFGSRLVGAASVVLFALSLAALGAASDSYTGYLIACGAIGLLAVGTNMFGYARAIANWFDARRGLAIGVAAAFQALGAVVLPILTQKVIAGANWSAAVWAIGLLELVVVLPIVLWLVRDAPAAREAGRATAEAPLDGAGSNVAVFVRLAVSFAIMGFSFYAVVSNIAFILEKAGLSATEIARFQSISGASVLVGRLLFGRLLDLWSAAAVGLLALAASAVFSLGLAHAETQAVAMGSAFFAGVAIGGESDLLPYAASRYWGRERMSRVLGFFLLAFVLGAALGPVAFARATAAFGGAGLPLYGLAILQMAPALLLLTLPPYPRTAI